MSGDKQVVLNTELKSDVKYIRQTLDEIASSIKDLRSSLQATSTMAFETKLKVRQIEKDLRIKADQAKIEHIDSRLVRVEKAIITVVSMIVMVVIGAILATVIRQNG